MVLRQLRYFLRNSNSESEISITTITTSAYFSSSRVDLNASIMYAGNLEINPTVSDIKTGSLSIRVFLVVVDSVVNNSGLSCLDSPVSRLNKVVFPAEVYPASEIVFSPTRLLASLCKARCFPIFSNFDFTDFILF